MIRRVIYTTAQAPGAIPNGTVVEKVKTRLNDSHQDGAKAKVLGSWGPFDKEVKRRMLESGQEPCDYFYFVEWEDRPGIPVGISGSRIKPAGWTTELFERVDKDG